MSIKFTLHPRSWIVSILSTVILTLVIAATGYAAEEAPKSIYLPMVTAPSHFSSERLIEAAHQVGALDDETALLYRVYANFEDPRLPAQYRGDDSLVAPSMALYEAQARLAALSPATQVALTPFFLPPLAEQSWHEQREAVGQTAAGNEQVARSTKITWLTTCQTDPNIKVWYQERYPEDAEKARQVCELVRGEIWPRLKSLMGRTPPDDSGEANNGGDGQLDFYLVSANTSAIGYRGCDNTPSHVYVHRTRWNKALLISAVMGAFLNGYDTADCLEYMWLYAATRTWAIDHVDSQDQWEHNYADDFLLHTDSSLDTYPVTPLEEQNQIGDGAYLWVWYAANLLKSPAETVPFFWEGATNPSSLAAVNSVMGEHGFEKEWKNFSGLNWNNEPVDVYKDLDRMPHSTKLTLDEAVTLDGAQDRTYEMDAEVRSLAAHTFRFTFNDPGVRSVLFYNPFKGGAWPTANVNAYYKLADQSWHIEDWTEEYGKGFCRDVEAERVEELVVVISNHEWQNPSHKLQPTKPPRLNATNMACRGWEFEGTATHVGTGQDYNRDDRATVKATFMRVPYGDDSGASSIDHFQVVDGNGSWSHTGNTVACGGSRSGNFDLTGGTSTTIFMFTKATDLASSSEYIAGDRRYSGFGGEDPTKKLAELSVTYTCPNSESYELPSASAFRWFRTEVEPTQEVSEDGKTITGSFTEIDADNFTTDTYTWTWKMTALPPE